MEEKNIAFDSTTHVEESSKEGSVDRVEEGKISGLDAHHHDADNFRLTFGKIVAVFAFQFGYQADVFIISMVGAALTPINRDIGPSPNYAWMAISFSIGSAALAAPMGRLGDIFGRRNFVMAGSVIAAVGCIVGATANTVNTVTAGMALAGVGSSMHQLAWSCLGELVPKKDRPLAFGFLETSLGLTSAFSAVIAYSFIQAGSWRYIFWFSFAFNIAASILVFFFYRPINQYIKEEGRTRWDQLKETDLVGNGLFIAGLTLFLAGLSFGGTNFPWRSAGTIAPIIVGIVLLIFTGVYEAKANLKYPCFPPRMFANIRGFTLVLVGIFLYGILYYASAVIWPLQVTVLYATNQIDIGWYSMAIGAGGCWGGPLIGWLFRVIGHTRWTFTGCLLILTVLSGVQAIVSPTTNVASTVLTVLNGCFIAGSSVISTTIIQLNVKHEYLGVATGVLVAFRGIGGSIGQTIYVSILQNRLTSDIPKYVALPLAMAGVPLKSLPVVIEDLLSGVYTSPEVAALTPEQLGIAAEGIKNAYSDSFRLIYLISIAFGVVAIVSAAFTRNADALMTNSVAIKLAEGAHIKAETDTGEGHILGRDDAEKFGDEELVIQKIY